MDKRKTYQVVLDIPTLNGPRDKFTTHPDDANEDLPTNEAPQLTRQDSLGSEETELENITERQSIPDVVFEVLQDEKMEETDQLKIDDLHDSNQYGVSAKSSRPGSQTESEMLLRSNDGDGALKIRSSPLSECLSEFEDCLRFSETNLLDSIQNNINSASNKSIDKEVDETLARDDSDNRSQAAQADAQQKPPDDDSTKCKKETVAFYTVESDEITIESGSLLFGGPYSPTTKPNSSDELGSFQFPSDKRQNKNCTTVSCCRMRNIKTSAIVAAVFFCLVFVAIILASTIPNKNTKAAVTAPREGNATITAKVSSTSNLATFSFTLKPSATSTSYRTTTDHGKHKETVTTHTHDNLTDYNDEDYHNEEN